MGSELNIAYDLSHVTQIRKILKNFSNNGIIMQFARVDNLFNGLTFRLFFDDFDDRRFFDIKLSFVEKIEVFRGAEIAKRKGWEVIIFVNKTIVTKKLPRRIESLLKEEIEDRKRGLIVEILFQRHLEELIFQDEEVKKAIAFISLPTEDEDWVFKIDRFLVLRNGTKVPVQIKSSLWGRVTHKESGSQIPSLIYSQDMPDEVLKEKILQICRSYQLEPKLIEHL